MSNSLNPNQKEAVLHQDSPLLILAGAGTGKTRVLTERIIYIINSYIANPHQILAVTFTNKAASEMKHRIVSQIGDLANNIWMGTFHGVATRILKRHPELVGLKPDFTIIDSDDVLRLLKQITADLNIDTKDYPIKNYQYQIERLKDKALLPSDLKVDNLSDRLPKFLEVYTRYQNRLQSLNCVDFGDLLLYNLKIFAQSPETLLYYQNKFQQILIDEYQDTNACQYQWLLKLAGSGCESDSEHRAKKINKNICAVGDDDQSIYSWRGAEIANILRFEKDFGNTKIIRLEQNYRSTPNILGAASHLIKHNKERHGKTLWTDSKSGSDVKFLNFISDRQEASGIADLISEIKRNEKTNLNQIAILVRAGYQTRSFEEAFLMNGIAYRIIGGLKFYDRKEIKDAIAYLRLIYNLSDDLAFERIVNLPKRGLGDAGFEKLLNKSRDEKCSLFTALERAINDGTGDPHEVGRRQSDVSNKIFKGKTKDALEIFAKQIKEWQGLVVTSSVKDLAQRVLEESGYVKMFELEKTPEAQGRLENLEEFISGLSEFESLTAFLNHVSLVSGDEKIDVNSEMVNIMTVHSAKGLEFDVVFIPGLEEGVFPSGRSINERHGLEEERRLLYVAITRARKILYLSMAQNRFIYGQMQPCVPSQFLRELPSDILFPTQESDDFVVRSKSENKTEESSGTVLGKRVFHQKFGYGKILEVDGQTLTIKFEKADTKKITQNFVTIL